MTKLSVAVLGAGRIGMRHARTVASLPDAHLAVLADPRPESKMEAVQLGVDWVGSADAAIWDSRVEAVLIATPTGTHTELIEECARARKPTFCEKPIALDVAATERALRVVETTGIPLQIGFQRRYDSGYAEARRRVAAGEIGHIHLFRSASLDPYPPSRDYILSCGGQFRDTAIHDIDMARFLTGLEIEEVSAYGATLGPQARDFREAGDWDTTVASLRFAGGVVGSVVNSRQSGYGYDVSTDILGDQGALKVGYERFTPLTRYGAWGAAHDYVPFFLERFDRAYVEEVRAFIEAVRHGRMVTPTGRDGLIALRVADAATESARRGGVPVRI